MSRDCLDKSSSEISLGRSKGHDMISLRETMRGGREIEQSRPWPRHVVDHTSWLRAIREISKGQGDMLGLWSDGADVHMLLLDHESSDIGIISIECPNGRFPSVAHMHPPALRLERAIRDIYGLEADGSLRCQALARSWPLGRATSRREAGAVRSVGRRLRLPRRGRRAAPSNPGGPRARRHYRARPFPLFSEWGSRRPSRGTARLRP